MSNMNLTNSEEKVLGLMKFCASKSDDGQFSVGIKTIMDRCGLSKPTVINSIKKLEQLEILTRIEKGNNYKNISSTYTLDQGKISQGKISDSQGKKPQGKISDSQGKISQGKILSPQGKKPQGKISDLQGKKVDPAQGKKLDPYIYNNINNIYKNILYNSSNSNTVVEVIPSKSNDKINKLNNISECCNSNTVEESIQGKENKNINNLVESDMLYDEIRSTIEKVRDSKGVEKVNHLKHLIELRDSGKSSSAQVQMMNKWINPNINLLKDSYAFELFERCKSLYDKVRKAVFKDNHQNIILFGPEWIDSMDELHKLAKQRKLPSKITTSGDYRVKVNRQSNIYDSTVSILTEYGLMDNEQLNRKKIDAVTKLINLTLKFTSSFETRDYLIDVNLVKETFGVKVIELNKSNDLIYDMYENYFNYVNQKVEEHNQKYN